MIEHKPPGLGTVKQLFALSGNQCAFEKCEEPLVDMASGKVTGRICHISARREKGPRFDYKQTEEENMSFDNLILMCPIHHDVIDSDIKSYTKERLLELKASHYDKHSTNTINLDDDKANKLIQNINIEKIKISSYFALSNVNHSQIAENIINNTDHTQLYLLERYISSLRQLEAVYEFMLPEKLYPEMDWSDALNDIAFKFESIRIRIKQYLADFAGFYDEQIESKLKECVGYCTEGGFEINHMEFEVSETGQNYANRIYEGFSNLLLEYKEHVREKLINAQS